MNENKQPTKYFPRVGIVSLDFNNDRLQTQVELLNSLASRREKTETRTLQRELNHLIRLIHRNLRQERALWAELGCYRSECRKNSCREIIELIGEFNHSQDHRSEDLTNLTAAIDAWLHFHVGDVIFHLKFHQRGKMIEMISH